MGRWRIGWRAARPGRNKLISRRETRSFLDRVYRGSVGLMLSAMTDGQTLSRAEIDELYDILKKAEEGRK